MLSHIWVGVRGAISSAARFWSSGSVAQWYGRLFQVGTCKVNVSGSFTITI
jgi:fluoride ion exporter CrcB/FEX